MPNPSETATPAEIARAVLDSFLTETKRFYDQRAEQRAAMILNAKWGTDEENRALIDAVRVFDAETNDLSAQRIEEHVRLANEWHDAVEQEKLAAEPAAILQSGHENGST